MEPGPSTPRLIGSEWQIYLGFSGLFAFGVALVFIFDRAPAPATITVVGLGVQAGLCVALAFTGDRTVTRAVLALRIVLLVALGGLAALPGYFFGPNSAISAFIGLALCFAGLRAGVAQRVAVVEGWLVYASVAAGQALTLALVLLGVLPDASITPVIVRDNPAWHHALNHAAIQVLYLAAFIAGALLQRRYRRLVLEHDDLVRNTSLKEALITEAKTAYRRALKLAGEGLFSGQRVGAVQLGRVVRRDGIREVYEVVDGGEGSTTVVTAAGAPVIDAAREAQTQDSGSGNNEPIDFSDEAGGLHTVVTPMPGELVSSVTHVVQEAYFQKMAGLYVWIVVLCLGGGSLTVLIAFDRRILLFGLACIVGIMLGMVLHWRLNRGSDDAIVHWSGIVMCGLAVGPGAVFGIHSGFAVVVGTIVFVLGAFRADQRSMWIGGLVFVPIAAMLAHGILFALMYSRTIPDLGYVPTLQPVARWWEPLLVHALVQAAFIGSFVAGVLVDRRHAELRLRIAEVARGAALKGDLLAEANAELESLLSRQNEGIFTNQTIGAYRIGRLLGRGGMGEVYEATGEAKRVALKVIRRERIGDPRTIKMFLDERDTVSRVRSEHVAGVIEADMQGENVPYIAMEYIEGQTLSKLLHAQSQLDFKRTRVLVRHIATGLADVHRVGVLHRDVKPQNIMLANSHGQDRWVLIDFGVARLASGGPDQVVVGTYAYMAPEQAMGKDVDARADLYSLCLVAYRALTGRPAYGDEVVNDPKNRRAPPDPGYFASFPRDVALAIRIGLAREPDDRFADAAELLDAFEAAWEGGLSTRLRHRAWVLLEREPWADPMTPPETGGELTRPDRVRPRPSSLERKQGDRPFRS